MKNHSHKQKLKRMVIQLEEGEKLTSEDVKVLKNYLERENRRFCCRLYSFLVGSTVFGLITLWGGMYAPSIKSYLQYGYLTVSLGLVAWLMLFRSEVSMILKRLHCLVCSREALSKDWEEILKTKKCRCGAVDQFNII